MNKARPLLHWKDYASRKSEAAASRAVGGRYIVQRRLDGGFSIDHLLKDQYRPLKQEAGTLAEAKMLAQADNDRLLSEKLSKASAT
jgi:hypothetical protein